ncbi:MAG TPA: LysE family translocator [Bauldia sp.]|nr:LysE family translocator [Bauldia sp.]
MALLTWLGFVAAALVVLFIPGPTVILVVSYALTQGRQVAVRVAAGVALGDLVAMTLSLAGLGAVIAASAEIFTALKLAGAAFLVYLGIRLWRSQPELPSVGPAPEPAGSSVFAHAFVVTALNPKSIAFFIAFVPQFIDHGRPLLPQLAIIEATFVTLATLSALGFALAADQLRRRIRRPGVLRWVIRAGASCLVGMAVATVAINRT